ncbi:MAG: hypothetical protein RLZ98_2080 [Pseudomonadota bacterium]
MNEHRPLPTPEDLPGGDGLLTTPTGVQSTAVLARRRWLVLVLNILVWLALLSGAAGILGAGGWSLLDVVLFTLFMLASPWTVLGFCNAMIGLWLLHGTRNGLRRAAPHSLAGEIPAPLVVRTAILMTLRNEDPARAISRLRIVKKSVDQTGEGAAFSYFILSDTNDPVIAAAEEAAVARWRRETSEEEAARIVYRRRTDNKGYKAGNVRDFCARWGQDYELMLPLDADSLMTGPSIVRMVRIMQAHPRLGILQSLVVGMPSASAFARMFQFGMRHGMRPYTVGQAWWSGDCGPFWGHNAVVRIKPFYEECELPELPGAPPLGGQILSHDQVEATFMRRAGYEVRVLPIEDGSWEENPPTMLDFAQRDVRWCQGNLQYLKLLDTPGLLPVSRFQLVWAIMMFIGLPAWLLMIALLPAAALEARQASAYPSGLAIGLYLTFLFMFLSPKLAGLADVALTRGGVARYGGRATFLGGALLEFVFSFIQSAVSTFRTSIFIFGLVFGQKVAWGGQSRDAYGISWRTAAMNLWPQTVFGLGLAAALLYIAPTVLLWSLPLTLGYIVAIPFAVATSSPVLGRTFRNRGICGIPEDFAPPAEIREAEIVR